MGKGINGLLKKYIENVHSEELKYKRNTGKQSKIGIDYQAFTHYLEKENVPSNVDSLFKAISKIPSLLIPLSSHNIPHSISKCCKDSADNTPSS